MPYAEFLAEKAQRRGWRPMGDQVVKPASRARAIFVRPEDGRRISGHRIELRGQVTGWHGEPKCIECGKG
jgi:hypothetical protein